MSTPSTPSRLPPLRPPPLSPARPPSPGVGAFIANDGASSLAPRGCELIVRDVRPAAGLTAAETIEAAIQANTSSSDDISISLKTSPSITLFRVSISSAKHSDTYCYVRLAQDVASLHSQPRPDLLSDWIPAIKALDASWAPAWSPARQGRDRLTWVKVSSLSGNPDKTVARKELDVIVAHLKGLGYHITSSWPFPGHRDGAVILGFTHEVTRLLKSGSFTIPPAHRGAATPSPPITVTVSRPFSQIEPVYAFELAVTGISQYDPSFPQELDKYFQQGYQDESGSLWVSSRVVGDAYLFVMKTWQATRQVLSHKDIFESHVQINAEVDHPRLVFDINNSSTLPTRPSQVIRDAGKSVQKMLDDVRSSVDSLRAQSATQFAAIDRRFLAVDDGMKHITQGVLNIAGSVQALQVGMFSQQKRLQLGDERSILLRKLDRLNTALDRSIAHDPPSAANIQTQIKELEAQLDAVDDNIANADSAITKSIAAPPTIPPPHITPTSVYPSRPRPQTPETPTPAPKRSAAEGSSRPAKRSTSSKAGADKRGNNFATTQTPMEFDDTDADEVVEMIDATGRASQGTSGAGSA